ncbi:MAG TPA: glucose 1-dehydrogenase [Pseudacidobacterium sp.]|nr:glucose 1-dehydrogenase [Pseudacidobacterium sp.]
MSKLQGKVAVVTGASKGIGVAIARQFGAEGASVVVNYASSKAGADKVVADITAKGGKAIAVQADLSKPSEIGKLFEETKKAFGKLDILVNNAGVYEVAPLEGITEEHYKKHFDLNVLGLILATQEAAKLIGPEGGSIINISSTITSITPPNFAVYAATKGAVDTITRTLAKELGPRKIRVNAINPGMVVTEGVQAAGYDKGDMRTYLESITPLGRIGQPEDIAPAAVFFASQDSSWITGEVLRVAGGVR